MQVLFFLLVIISLAFAPYTNQPCTRPNGSTGTCHVQYSELRFTGPLLRATIRNHHTQHIIGGELELRPEGYGCILFFCAWQPGTTLLDPTCSWPGMSCSGEGHLIAPGESKTVEMDFTEALIEAGGTSGCCSNDGCCNLRGTATHKNGPDGEYAKIYMSFSCTLRAPYQCTVTQFEDEEVNPIDVEENLIDE